MKHIIRQWRRIGSLFVALPLSLSFVIGLWPTQTTDARRAVAQSFDVAATVTSLVQTREAIHVLLTATAIQRGEVATPAPSGGQAQGNRPPATPATNPVVEIRIAELNVRAGPGTNFAVLARVSAGEQYAILGRSANCAWLQIARGNETVGWISGGAQYVTYTVSCESITVTQP